MNANAPSEQAIELLLRCSDEQLYEQLGIRAMAIVKSAAVAGSFQPAVFYEGSAMGARDEVREYGRRLARRWNREACSLVCGADPDDAGDRQELLASFGMGETAAAAALCSLFVAHLGMAPALATVLAVITLKHFFRPAYEEFCELWKEELPQ